MICKQCGAKDTIKTICNIKGEIEQYICTECGCTANNLEEMKKESKPKKIDLSNIELKKIWRIRDDIFIKISTMMGNKFFKKYKGTVYVQIQYTDFDSFEYEILDTKVDFKNLFEDIMK